MCPRHRQEESKSLPGRQRGGGMVYKCIECKRIVEIDSEYGGVRCPYCGHRVLLKERGTIIKRIKAE